MKMAGHIVLAVAIAYAALVALVFVFQHRLIYFPQTGREITVTPQAYGLAYESLRLRTEDGETLAAWCVPAGNARGTVLLLHGNAGNISHRIDYLAMFARLGYATLIIDYRGYGESTGTPSEEGTYRDALAAWRWLTETRGVKPANIVVFGESLGGGPATWLAAQHAPRALVLASTFTSIPDLGAQLYPFLPVRRISRFRYDNHANLEQLRVPVLIAHSRDDEIIPFAHGERLYAAARDPKAFIEMRGGHNAGFVFARAEWIHALAAFLGQHASTMPNK